MREYGFLLTRILTYKDRRTESQTLVFGPIRENTGQ